MLSYVALGDYVGTGHPQPRTSSALDYRLCAVYQLGRLAEFLDLPAVPDLLRELLDRPDPVRDLEAAVADVAFFRRKRWCDAFDLGLYRIALYVLVRGLRPRLAVETGVLHGITTNFILTALRRNRSGRLISVDLPSYYGQGPANRDGYDDTLPPDKQPGWVIPPGNRRRWDLRLASSADELPKVFAAYREIDLFLHDSEHTYENMTRELSLAWPHLGRQAVLVCDNIDANTAFLDFCQLQGRRPLLLPEALPDSDPGRPRFGVLRKV